MLILQKVIGSFVELPGLLILIFFLLSLYLLKKKEKKLFFLFITLSCLIWFVSTDIGLLILAKPYEDKYSDVVLSEEDLENSIIVVFSGGIIRNVPYGETQYDQIGNHSLMRLYRAFEIYKKAGSKIIISGGNVYEKSGSAIAEIMKDVMISWGVPKSDIIVEDKAKTTFENAEYSLELIPEGVNTILLVTSAIHMHRSYSSFNSVFDKRKNYYNLIACPGDYRIEQSDIGINNFLPGRGALSTFMAVFHEWIGNIFYLLK